MKTIANKISTQKKEYIIAAGISFAVKFIMIFTVAYPLRITGDELFLFYLPAKLAGMDWSSSMYNYRYYGYGFSIFLVPFFQRINDPVILYRITLIIVAIIQMIIPIICCYLLRNFFSLKESKYVITGALIGTFSVSLYPTYMYNEHIYIVYVWLAFFVLAKLWENKENNKLQIKYSFLLSFAFLGALTVHQRAITLFLSFCVLYALALLIFRKRIGYITIVTIAYIVGNKINNILMYKIIDWLKYSSIPVVSDEKYLSQVQNTQVSMSFSLMSIFDKEYMKAVVKVFIGNLNTVNVFTIGFFSLSIILGIIILNKIYLKKATEQDTKLFIFGIFGIAAVLITIAGLANTWGWGIKQAYIDNNSSSDSLRGLIYLRYYACYYIPVLIGVIGYIINTRIECIRYLKYSLILSWILLSYWIMRVIPLMMNTKMGFGALILYTPVGYMLRDVKPPDYIWCVVVFSLILVLGAHSIKRYNKCYWLYVMFFLVIWRYTYNTYIGDGKSSLVNYYYADETQKILSKMEEAEMSTPIYVYESSIVETGQGLLYEVQFLNMNTILYRGRPIEDEKDAIYITIYPEQEKELINLGYECIQIDDNEYMFANNKKTMDFIQNLISNKDTKHVK